MPRYMVIEGGVAVNAIKAESADAVPGLTLVQSDTAKIGDTYAAGEFTTPAPVVPVPQVVTMRQARQALRAAGYLSAVSAAIAAMPDGPAKEDAQIEWEYSQTVERNRGLVAQIGTALGLTSAEVDALFVQAASL